MGIVRAVCVVFGACQGWMSCKRQASILGRICRDPRGHVPIAQPDHVVFFRDPGAAEQVGLKSCWRRTRV